MGLINCPDCGNQVSKNAEQCPNCGYPVKKKREQKQNLLAYIAFALIIISLIISQGADDGSNTATN